ncbi:MAG TPA: hypothetical protein ENJ01_08640 [Gammaproteobacteria bacterium]|nr:hypothetical protein [Gammaproteobacteria bacterium]
MDGFRLSLLAIGILVVLMIYIMGRRGESERSFSLFTLIRPLFKRVVAWRPTRSVVSRERRPDDDVDLDWDDEPISADADGDAEDFDIRVHTLDEEEPAVTAGEEFILVLRILAPRGAYFSGKEIHAAAQAVGMRHGDMDIFHLYTQVQPPLQPRVICSLANGIEPGHFRREELDTLSTPGLTLFLQLPGPLDGREAFEKMLEVGRRLAQQLDGELYDESRSVLTAQTVSHLKEKLEAWRFKMRMAQIRRRHH